MVKLGNREQPRQAYLEKQRPRGEQGEWQVESHIPTTSAQKSETPLFIKPVQSCG